MNKVESKSRIVTHHLKVQALTLHDTRKILLDQNTQGRLRPRSNVFHMSRTQLQFWVDLNYFNNLKVCLRQSKMQFIHNVLFTVELSQLTMDKMF